MVCPVGPAAYKQGIRTISVHTRIITTYIFYKYTAFFKIEHLPFVPKRQLLFLARTYLCRVYFLPRFRDVANRGQRR